MMTPKLTAQAQIAALQREMAELRTRMEEIATRALAAEQAARDTHDMVQGIYGALMTPTPGQSKGLLDRLAIVAINFESGQRVAGWVVWAAGIIAAIGALYAAVRVGWVDRI